jgi:phytoene dehydrogenase-like protein
MIDQTAEPIGRSYDAVVVGAGNGGLGAAARLAAMGVKVLLLEQHSVPGGFASSFVRGRFEFETAMHLIADVGPPDNRGSVREFLEDDLAITLDWVEVPEAFRLILTDPGEDLDLTIPYGVEDFIEAIEKADPGSGQAVANYVDLFMEVVDALSYLGRSKGNPDRKVLTSRYANFLKTAPYTVDQVARAMKIPERAKKIVHAPWVYLGVPTSRMNFTVFGGMMGKLIAFSGFIPPNRSHQFTSAVEARIRELGGDTQFNTRVDQILVEDGQVAGVVTSHGERIATKHVVANVAPALVYNRLISPQTEVPEIAFKESNARRFAVSAVNVYLGLDAPPERLGLDNYSYFVFANMNTDDVYESFGTIDTPRAQATACLNAALPDCSPPGTTILFITTLYRPEAWAGVKPHHYVRVKNEVAKGLIADFEKATGAPIRKHIEEIEVATPVTFARYARVHGGTIYGYEPETWDSLVPRMMAMMEEKHIKGLEFAGGYSFRCHGYSSSFMSGQVAGLLTYAGLMEERG